MKTSSILLTILLTIPACTNVSGDLRTGKFTIRSGLTNRKFGAIEWRMGTNYFRIEGYESDQVQALKAGLDAGLKVAAQAIKP